jgi:hypothetical protein
VQLACASSDQPSHGLDETGLDWFETGLDWLIPNSKLQLTVEKYIVAFDHPTQGDVIRIPTIRGLIDRRLLVNFRVDADVLARQCPAPFSPQLLNGYGVAGICLIRLKHVRPSFLPSFMGISSENAAHRIAVQWESEGLVRTGVYIPRRDTSSLLNALAGGRVFPGVHQRAKFKVNESHDRFQINMKSLDGSAHLAVDGSLSEALPSHSLFDSVEDVSDFFEAGSLGYSPSNAKGKFDGLELRTFNWDVKPIDVSDVVSSFFDDRNQFPKGSVLFDNALLMRGIDHEWHQRDTICCEGV